MATDLVRSGEVDSDDKLATEGSTAKKEHSASKLLYKELLLDLSEFHGSF